MYTRSVLCEQISKIYFTLKFFILSAADSRISIGLNVNEYSYLTRKISVYFSLVSSFFFGEFFLW